MEYFYIHSLTDSVEMGNGSAAPRGDADKDAASEDQIIGSIGEWGRWQAKWFLVLCFVALPSGFPRYARKGHFLFSGLRT